MNKEYNYYLHPNLAPKTANRDILNVVTVTARDAIKPEWEWRQVVSLGDSSSPPGNNTEVLPPVKNQKIKVLTYSSIFIYIHKWI